MGGKLNTSALSVPPVHVFGSRCNLYTQVGNLGFSSRHWKNGGIFFPRCMECRRGLAMRILSARTFVCWTRAL